MHEQEIRDDVTLAQNLLWQGEYAFAADCLTRALEAIREFTGEPALGLPRGIDQDGGLHHYALLNGSVWEFDRKGWKELMERIAAGRGYSLGEYGRCLTYEVTKLKNLSASAAKFELSTLGG